MRASVEMANGDDKICLTCKKKLEEDVLNITCTECEFSYHLGECSGVTKAKNEKLRKDWRCPTCVKARNRSGSSSKQSQDTDFASILTGINAKLSTLLDLKNTVDKIEQSVQMMSANYDEVLKKTKENTRQIAELKKRVESTGELKNEVKTLRQEVNDLEWQSRKLNLELHGIRKTENEDLLSKVNAVARTLELSEITGQDIVALHRLPSRPDKTPGIIIRFSNAAVREQWLNNRRKLKRGKNEEYILENMTRQTKALLWTAKDWAKENNYQYAWHRNGKVFVRREQGTNAVMLSTKDDLLKLE